MAVNRGKQWEAKLKEDFSKMSGAYIYRVPDQLGGLKGQTGICDFIAYKFPKIFFIEAKTILGNTFPLTNFTQFDKLMSIPNIQGVHRGVMLWFQEHQRVLYVPLLTIAKMKQDGKKSVNIRTIDQDGYDYLNIPSVQKRVFLDSDYSVMMELPDNDW
jgi:hypothetical protein